MESNLLSSVQLDVCIIQEKVPTALVFYFAYPNFHENWGRFAQAKLPCLSKATLESKQS